MGTHLKRPKYPSTPEKCREIADQYFARAKEYENNAHHAHDYAPSSFITGRSGRHRSGLNKRSNAAANKMSKYLRLAAEAKAIAGAMMAKAREIETAPARREMEKELRKRAHEKDKAERLRLRESLETRIHVYDFPTGFSFCDITREVMGDYLQLAYLLRPHFMSYKTYRDYHGWELSFKKVTDEEKDFITRRASLLISTHLEKTVFVKEISKEGECTRYCEPQNAGNAEQELSLLRDGYMAVPREEWVCSKCGHAIAAHQPMCLCFIDEGTPCGCVCKR